MIFRVVYKSALIFLPFSHNSRVWQTDGRTEFSSLNRICIPCIAVKTMHTINVQSACENEMTIMAWRSGRAVAYSWRTSGLYTALQRDDVQES